MNVLYADCHKSRCFLIKSMTIKLSMQNNTIYIYHINEYMNTMNVNKTGIPYIAIVQNKASSRPSTNKASRRLFTLQLHKMISTFTKHFASIHTHALISKLWHHKLHKHSSFAQAHVTPHVPPKIWCKIGLSKVSHSYNMVSSRSRRSEKIISQHFCGRFHSENSD